MIKRELGFLAWTALGIILFSISFPGYISNDGLPAFAFIALFPLYYIVQKMDYKESIFFGFIYGAGSYLLFNYWLKGFDPVTFSVLPTIMGFYYILLFLLIKFVYNNFKRFQYIPLSFSWIIYELFKGENSIGYTYGTIAHTMYRTTLFTGIVDITGTYILSLLIVFPSIYLAYLLNVKHKNWKEIRVVTLCYLLVFIASIIYTHVNKVNYKESKTIRTSLIQHNSDSWAKGSDQFYKDTLDNLLELSVEAEKFNPDLVLWSETAFIPAIEWHKEYKSNKFRLNLVNRLETFVGGTTSDYLIGANETIGNIEPDIEYYNSAYIYHENNIVGKYRKVTLVPFTERFPYPNLLPWLHSYIKSIGGKDLLPGDFNQKNLISKDTFITPLICYEDTFSKNARLGILKGGDLIVNLTNDAWSIEEACSKQHLAAAIFRSIENRRSFARVGNGGYSAIIDPNGEIIASLPILTRGQLTFDVPIYNDKMTFYTKYGNVFDKLLILSFLIMLLTSIFKSTLSALRKKTELSQNLV